MAAAFHFTLVSLTKPFLIWTAVLYIKMPLLYWIERVDETCFVLSAVCQVVRSFRNTHHKSAVFAVHTDMAADLWRSLDVAWIAVQEEACSYWKLALLDSSP